MEHNRKSKAKRSVHYLCVIAVVAAVICMTGCDLPFGITIGGSASDTTSSVPPNNITSFVNTDPQPEELKMPDLVGMQKEKAVKKLAEIGLTATITETESDEEKEGCVFSHVPTAGKTVKEGDNVTLYVAKKKTVQSKSSTASSKSSSKTNSRVNNYNTYLYCTASDFVALRSDKSVNSTELAKIPRGDSMLYLNEKSGKWYFVQYGSLQGYVYEDYVSYSKPSVSNVYLYCCADDFVSLRKSADANSTELARIPRGDSMIYLNVKSGKWYYVRYGSKDGYVYEDYVSYSQVQRSPKAYDYLYCTASDFVALRSGPDTSYTELARIPHGDKMIYLYQKSGRWYYVQYGSKTGYVYDAYVTSP